MFNNDKNIQTHQEKVRVGGKLKEVVTIKDEKGHVLSKTIRPLMLEFYLRDILQVIVGASLLAVPMSFTEEVWNLGQRLPLINIIGIFVVSITFIFAFVYHNYYKGHVKGHFGELIKRVLGTYLFSILVVGFILSLIQLAPWQTDWLLALKRAILIAFPASMSAAVADMIK